jgi:hypothetical protein
MAEAAYQGAGDDSDVKRFCDRVKAAKGRKAFYDSLIDDCYQYALPLRERTTSTGDTLPSLDHLYDSTVIADVQALASQMLDDIWPTDSAPFSLVAGQAVPENEREEANRLLADVTDDLIETINNSNFRSVAHEALMDWTIGEGFLLPEMGPGPTDPIIFRTLTLPEAIPDAGPDGRRDLLARYRKVKARDAAYAYPGGEMPSWVKEMATKSPENDVEFLEGWERDRSRRDKETWVWRVVAVRGEGEAEERSLIERKTVEGAGSRPFADFAYMRVAGEAIGRGPVMITLPDVKSLNLAVQMILENADLAIGGLWQAEDDGVLNPETVILEPRTIVPIMKGSSGLSQVNSPGDIGVGDWLVNNLRYNIHQVMLGDDLGPAQGTPMSATEVMQRTSNTARRRAGPYTRLIRELLFTTVQRVAYIRKAQGRIKLPPIDGRQIAIRPLGPLTRAQAQDEILRMDRFMEMTQVRLGQQQAALMIKGDEYSAWLAEKMGVDPNLIRTKAERSELAAAIAELAQAAPGAMGGGGAA